MANAQPWVFRQIGGDKTLTLIGAIAPHGRPRQGAVVSDGYGQRANEVYYNGDGPPTRHFFGTINDHITLKGRWMDRSFNPPTPGSAAQQVLFVKGMIKDALPVTIGWGNDVAMTGWIMHILPERESPAEIVYTITIHIDSDDQIAPATPPEPLQPPIEIVLALGALFDSLNGVQDAPADLTFPGDFFDSINDALSTINSISASLLSVANSIDNFETASAATLNRFRGGIAQLKTAYVTLLQTSENAEVDIANYGVSAKSLTKWTIDRDSDQEVCAKALVRLTNLDRQAEIAIRGRVNQTAHAQAGDTWESLSKKHYGGIDKADVLRQANLVRGGTKPQPGRSISIPKG